MKEKKERDWKFIIGMVVLIAIFAVMGGAFWNMVGKQAQIVKEKAEKKAAGAGSKRDIRNLYRDRRISENRTFCRSEQWYDLRCKSTGRRYLQ